MSLCMSPSITMSLCHVIINVILFGGALLNCLISPNVQKTRHSFSLINTHTQTYLLEYYNISDFQLILINYNQEIYFKK